MPPIKRRGTLETKLTLMQLFLSNPQTPLSCRNIRDIYYIIYYIIEGVRKQNLNSESKGIINGQKLENPDKDIPTEQAINRLLERVNIPQIKESPELTETDKDIPTKQAINRHLRDLVKGGLLQDDRKNGKKRAKYFQLGDNLESESHQLFWRKFCKVLYKPESKKSEARIIEMLESCKNLDQREIILVGEEIVQIKEKYSRYIRQRGDYADFSYSFADGLMYILKQYLTLERSAARRIAENTLYRNNCEDISERYRRLCMYISTGRIKNIETAKKRISKIRDFEKSVPEAPLPRPENVIDKAEIRNIVRLLEGAEDSRKKNGKKAEKYAFALVERLILDGFSDLRVLAKMENGLKYNASRYIESDIDKEDNDR